MKTAVFGHRDGGADADFVAPPLTFTPPQSLSAGAGRPEHIHRRSGGTATPAKSPAAPVVEYSGSVTGGTAGGSMLPAGLGRPEGFRPHRRASRMTNVGFEAVIEYLIISTKEGIGSYFANIKKIFLLVAAKCVVINDSRMQMPVWLCHHQKFQC
ncbi:hypothetical protein Ddc_08004 [Ditylenchus destructor]|nr:hypothetical protein Ddc_08004 [Ditylenchus destructor]